MKNNFTRDKIKKVHKLVSRAFFICLGKRNNGGGIYGGGVAKNRDCGVAESKYVSLCLVGEINMKRTV